MSRPLLDFQRLLLGQIQECTGDPLAERVASAVTQVATNGPCGAADLAVLVRQVLLRSAAPGVLELRVPRRAGWPDERMWRDFGFDASAAGTDHVRVRAQMWRPSWLDAGAETALLAAYREDSRRADRSVPSDPMVAALTGHARYSSPGQREGVRAAFLAPSGSTVVVNLPTGAGKTLIFQLPALLAARDGGVTLVIVPTVALARDQSERFAALLGEPGRRSFGYYGGLDDAAKRAMRKAVADGTQPIVFASPEATFGSLRGPLFDVASRGQLRCFAIDEAHIVAQWGQQFRPEFQALAGLRDALLAACPHHARFRTLLLTATLTQETYNTLRFVFGTTPFQIVSEPLLRPEPTFMISAADSESERTARVLEALCFLPRPALLYVTEREDAKRLFERIQSLGFVRSRLVRGGDLDGPDGHKILHSWRTRSVDLIVATSAFGLGVDQSDVRTVVHACLPETMDRFYQELGRAGRDGAACVSLLVSAARDVAVAQRIGGERLLSVDRAFERWTSMWAGRRRHGDQSRVLSLDALPSVVEHASDLNASWNLRTLVLMARAGMIRFGARAPVSIDHQPGESDEALFARRRRELERFYREVVVDVRDARHSDLSHWAMVVKTVRSDLRAADQRDLDSIIELRDLKRPLNEIFQELYTLTEPSSQPPPLRGSCPITRARLTDRYSGLEPELLTLQLVVEHRNDILEALASRLADESQRCWIAVEPPTDSRRRARWLEELRAVLRCLAACGISEFALPHHACSAADWHQLSAYSPHRFVVRSDLACGDPAHARPMPLRRFSLVDDTSPEAVAAIMSVSRPLHIIAVSASALDPLIPTRTVLATRQHARWDDFLAEIES